MGESLDIEAMLQRFRDRAHAVRSRPLPPVAGEERTPLHRAGAARLPGLRHRRRRRGDASRTASSCCASTSARADVLSDGGRTSRFDRAIAAIDAANADDPNTIEVRGEVRPEGAGPRRADDRVGRAASTPTPSEAQLLAARAHHLRRWSVPRGRATPRAGPATCAGAPRCASSTPPRWPRSSPTSGYDAATIERVQRIINKEGLGTRPGRAGPRGRPVPRVPGDAAGRHRRSARRRPHASTSSGRPPPR